MTNRNHAALCGIAVGIACTIAHVSFAQAGFCWGAGCGTNSATVGDGIVFDELNSKGVVTPDNIRLVSAQVFIDPVFRPVTLDIKGHDLTAIDVATPERTYFGARLLKMKFTIEHRDGRSYDVQVTKVCTDKETRRSSSCKALTFWVKPYKEVPYYELQVTKTHTRSRPPLPRRFPRNPDEQREEDSVVDGRSEQLCKGEHLNGDVLFTSVPNAAIFFEGDRYSPEKKEVTTTQQTDGWFNIACAGAAPAKMHLLRHSSAGSTNARKTTPDQRTAMLKMLTADYCGDGRTWTADGTPLHYADAREWYTTPGFPTRAVDRKVEAVWGTNGALCLDDPRRLARTSPPVTSSCKPPGVTRQEVVAACKANTYRSTPPWRPVGVTGHEIPPCSAAWWLKARRHLDVVYVMSANKALEPDGGDYCGGIPVTSTTTPPTPP